MPGLWKPVSSSPMQVDPLYLALELGAAGFFVWAALAAARRGRLPFLELVSAAIFGVLLEEGDQLVFESYHYSPHFLLTADRAPIVIGLTWALIIAGAMRITDALGIRRRYAPFVDAVLAISLDLAFDAIAIRMGLWTWRGLSYSDGWFGVPAGNFYAWLFVTFGFSLMTRWLRDAAAARPWREWLQLLVPIPAWFVILVALVPFAQLRTMLDNRPGGGLAMFLLTFVVFVAIAAYAVWGPNRAAPNGERLAILELNVAFTTRLAIHLYFIGALLYLSVPWTAPVLAIVAALLLAGELPLSRLVRGRARRSALASSEAKIRPMAHDATQHA
jgi:Carotenoid biosynthesis protein